MGYHPDMMGPRLLAKIASVLFVSLLLETMESHLVSPLAHPQMVPLPRICNLELWESY